MFKFVIVPSLRNLLPQLTRVIKIERFPLRVLQFTASVRRCEAFQHLKRRHRMVKFLILWGTKVCLYKKL